ncbi:MFS-type transporter SLC18B1-like [Corticium candelabrum]|uniref:MFS-type transporter SLC18B1-like n=1 Tax=Corticium candelabrum TaxID=121492 RepID=UPI002E252B1E|nr:MFS-type transporter SLC18B1-like [Corticium candelabrum]
MKGSKADTEVGLMLGSFQLSAFVASIFVEIVDTWASFISLSILIRFIMGFGEAAVNAAAFTLVLSMFPSHPATALAVLELPEALGLTTGELIGGFLYGSYGFLFPFAVFGGALLIFILSFIDTTIAVYLSDTFGWSATKIGLVMLDHLSWIILSLLLGGCSLMLIDPSFVFNFYQDLGMINSAVSMGFAQDMSLNGVVSGLVLAAVFSCLEH